MKRKVIVIAISVVAILCCLAPTVGLGLYWYMTTETERIQRSNEAFYATRTALAIHGPRTPGPRPEIWVLEGSPSVQHGLWDQDCLMDEHTPTLIGPLSGGTQMTPAGSGCQPAAWDTGDPEIHPGGPYIFCHVQVLDGPMKNRLGWVNQNFIDK